MSEQSKPRYQGLGIAAGFWWCGTIAWLAPVYVGLDGLAKWVLNILGAGFVVIAFVGAMFELATLWKNEAFTYFGLGLLFLVPSGLLHALAKFTTLPPPWLQISKGSALLLDAIGGFVFLFGLAYWGTPGQPEEMPKPSPEEKAEAHTKRRELFASAGVLLLTVITAIVKVVFGIG